MIPTKSPKLSLASQLLLLGALPAVVMFVALMAFFTSARLDDARANLSHNGQMQADSLAPALEYAVVSGNTRALEQVLERSLVRSDADWIRVTDVIDEEIGFVSNGTHPPNPDNSHFNIHTAEILQEPVEVGSGDLFAGSWSGSSGALRVGTIEVGVNADILEAREQEILWSSVIVGGVVLVVTLLLVNYFLNNVLRPIHSLGRRVSRLMAGDYQQQPVAVRNNASEIIEFQQQLNNLASHLQALEKARKQTLETSEAARAKAEQASQAKSEFLTAMSNDLRTPLHGVLSTLDLVCKDPLSSQQADYLVTVRQSTEDLLTVISDILDYASMSNGTFSPENQQFDLRSLIENCAASFRLAADQKGTALELTLPGEWGDSVVVLGDAARVRQILAGLLDNALKFSNNGSISIRAHLASDNGQTVTLNCTVADSSTRPTAQQLDSDFGGFGQNLNGEIGLSYVQQMVELVGGHVKVENDTRHGSSICFELDFVLAGEPGNPAH